MSEVAMSQVTIMTVQQCSLESVKRPALTRTELSCINYFELEKGAALAASQNL